MKAIPRPWGAMHISVEQSGSGLPALLLHSLGTDHRMWRLALPVFSDLGTVVGLDFRGHGLSALASEPYTIADLAEDALAAMDAADLERAVVIGCSVGGLVAQRLALDAPDRVQALVLSNTAARIGSAEMWAERIAMVEAHGIEAVTEQILDRWFTVAMRSRPDLALWRTMLHRVPAAGYTALCRAIAAEDLSARLGTLDTPCLVVGGASDQSTPPAQVRGLAEAIPGADCVVFDGAGHIPAIEVPEAFAARVTGFLRERVA